ncbi:hypothetical protein BLNAU_16512 [Blattamonas nauphoetae]|uniref:Uncharacterized protein n=1 Tax=Blattamonas nauphoetae TaxID=2049346 RepID=A0ABQ9X9B7_9EUKA|nr:hypothetical protein BLNAU_16512 [Blattamonas nauphoetae]
MTFHQITPHRTFTSFHDTSSSSVKPSQHFSPPLDPRINTETPQSVSFLANDIDERELPVNPQQEDFFQGSFISFLPQSQYPEISTNQQPVDTKTVLYGPSITFNETKSQDPWSELDFNRMSQPWSESLQFNTNWMSSGESNTLDSVPFTGTPNYWHSYDRSLESSFASMDTLSGHGLQPYQDLETFIPTEPSMSGHLSHKVNPKQEEIIQSQSSVFTRPSASSPFSNIITSKNQTNIIQPSNPHLPNIPLWSEPYIKLTEGSPTTKSAPTPVKKLHGNFTSDDERKEHPSTTSSIKSTEEDQNERSRKMEVLSFFSLHSPSTAIRGAASEQLRRGGIGADQAAELIESHTDFVNRPKPVPVQREPTQSGPKLITSVDSRLVQQRNSDASSGLVRQLNLLRVTDKGVVCEDGVTEIGHALKQMTRSDRRRAKRRLKRWVKRQHVGSREGEEGIDGDSDEGTDPEKDG